MNNLQAKEILLCYRPGAADQDDTELAAALELVGRDAELARWFREQQAIRETLRSRFQQIPVPPGLKEQILSERKARSLPAVRRPRILLATAAAALLCLLAITSFYFRPHQPDTLAEFRGRMAEIVLREYPKMDLETNDLGRIRQFLAAKQAPGNYVLPPALEKVSGTGCTILKWRGTPVSMICFNSGTGKDPNEQSDLFLFVIDQTAVNKTPHSASTQFAQLNRMATATWSSGDKTYLLGGFGDQGFIQKYL